MLIPPSRSLPTNEPAKSATSRGGCPALDAARVPADAQLPRHDFRLPDERPRLRADQGHARGARPRRGARPGRGRRARLQHLHDPREARPALRRAPRAGQRAQGARPGEGDRRRRLLRRGAAGAALLALPVRRRRVRARLDPAPGRVARRGRRGRRARRVRDRRGARVRRPAAAPPRAPLPGLGADLDGLQLGLLVLHRAVGARPRGLAPAGRDPRRGRGPRARGRQGADAARPERQLVRPRRRQRLRGAAARRATPSRASSGSASRARTRRTSARP